MELKKRSTVRKKNLASSENQPFSMIKIVFFLTFAVEFSGLFGTKHDFDGELFPGFQSGADQ